MKIHQLEKLTDEKWVNLFAVTYEHNGHTGRWVFASRRKKPYGRKTAGDAVIIVPILVEKGQPNRLVLIKEFRVPVGGYIHAFPAGLLEKGEKIEQAVRREMLEETGLEVLRFKRITPALYSTSGLSDESAPMAFVDVRAGPAANKPSKERHRGAAARPCRGVPAVRQAPRVPRRQGVDNPVHVSAAWPAGVRNTAEKRTTDGTAPLAA